MNWLHPVFFLWGFLLALGIFVKNRYFGIFLLSATIGGPLTYGIAWAADRLLTQIGAPIWVNWIVFLVAVGVFFILILAIGFVIWERRRRLTQPAW
ncbi:hypothetical protein KJ953_00350 [Patescibacteria group bacterium]|nr:hypothetical protein [Patescibacteria group bacterium]MBU1256131.1 hypothetical protein [Patescibacteria group bacterium]MBU1457888.1 hypothetical protein [Patescibacteria group bacterium]